MDELSERQKQLLEQLFNFHPVQPGQVERYTTLRAAFGDLARLVMTLTPESAEQTLAIRDLHRANLQANAAIACNE